MDSDTRGELHRLRARAYGHAADIHDDPVALARLQELEELHASSSPMHESEIDSEPVPERDAAVSRGAETAAAVVPPSTEAADDRGELSEASEPEQRARTRRDRRRPRTPRRDRLIWAASVLIAGSASAAITYGAVAITPVPVSSGAPQIDDLEPADVALPAGWMGAGPSSAVFEFSGLTAFETASGMGWSSGTGECLMIVRDDQIPADDEADGGSYSFEGPVYSGCLVGVFPATVEVPLDSNAPEELAARFPDGVALQFVLDEDRLGVYLDGE